MWRRKADWIGHILRRKCLLKDIIERKIEGGIEVTGRRGRKRKQLLDDLKKTRGYFKFKKKALYRSVKNSSGKRLWSCSQTDCGENETCWYKK
jgi:hypothetical protein